MDSNTHRPSDNFVDLLTSQQGGVFSFVEDSVQLSSSQVPLLDSQGAEASSYPDDSPIERREHRLWMPVEDIVLISS